MAGEINKVNCINKNGKVKINEANKDIFKFDKKISGNAVKIILLFWESLRRLKRGSDNISPMKDAL